MQGASQQFVLVSLDFPRGPDAQGKVPNPQRNQELSEKYGIEYFPSVILMTADGEEYLRTGNIGAEAPEYLEHLRTSAAAGKQALLAARALKEKYDQAEDKAAVVREAIAAMEAAPEGAASRKTLAEVVRQGLTLDPANKAGLKSASLTALVKSGLSSPAEDALAMESDPRNEAGLYELVVAREYERVQDDEARDTFLAHAQTLLDAGKVHDVAKVSMTFAVAAFFHSNSRDDAEAARPFAAKALALGELPENVASIMEEILGTPAKEVEE